MTDDELKSLMQECGFVNDKCSPYIAHGSLESFRKLAEAIWEDGYGAGSNWAGA